MMRRKIGWRLVGASAAALLLCMSSAAVRGQESTGTIAGTVTDWRGEPVAGASVVLEPETAATVLTDDEGRFEIAGLAPGTYSVKAQAEALTSETRSVTVAAGATAEVELRLEPFGSTLDEIEVTAGYSINRTEPVPTVTLTSEQIRRLPHFGNDMFRALTYLPGVSGNDLSAQFNVRGGLYRENMVRIDGLEIYEPYHLKDFQGIFSIIDPEMVGTINLVNGGFASEYGDRMTGVLDLTTARPTAPRQFNLGLSISAAWLSGSGNFADGRGRWLASGRRGYLDLVLKVAGPEDDEQKGDGPRYWDMLGSVDYDLTDSQNLSLNLLASGDSLDEEEFETEEGVPTREIADTSYGNSYLWASHQAVLGPRLLVNTLASVGRVDRDRRVGEIGYDFFDVRDERDMDLLTLRQDWGYLPSPRHYLKWGFEVRTYDTTYDYFRDLEDGVGAEDPLGNPRREISSFTGDFSGDQYALYLADRIRVTDALTLEAGVRYDEQTLTDESQVSPRLNLVYNLGDAGVLRAAWGHFHQSQRPYELQVEDGETEFQPAERAEHYLLGWERPLRLWGDDYSFRVDAYWRRVSDSRVRYENLFTPFEPNPEVRRDRVMIAPERSDARGLELFLARRGGRTYDWWVNYTLSEVTDRLDGRDTARNIDQRHALNLNLNYRLGPKWNFNFAWVYHSGWPTTFVDAEVVELPDGSIEAAPVLGPIYAENLSDYHRLDVRASRYYRFANSSLELFLDVQNLYARENAAGFEIDERNFVILPDGSANYVPDPEYWLGIVPSIGVSWRF